jgi:putative nucleotidyltransferase with HDIG domain
MQAAVATPSPHDESVTVHLGFADQHPQHQSHGEHLTLAFQALEAFPALADSRDLLLSVLAKGNTRTADIACAIESDVAVAVAVLRMANAQASGHERADTAVSAVKQLGPDTVQRLAERTPTFGFFKPAGMWGSVPRRFRLHALTTQRVADRIAAEIEHPDRDQIAMASLLHDIGKLVLMHAYPGYPARVHQGATTPSRRHLQERRELGIDHALVGGVLARRWGLPDSLACAIERHHNSDAEGNPALIRLADMLAHYEQGEPVAPNELAQAAAAIHLSQDALRQIMRDLPSAATSQRLRYVDQCPLTAQELAALRELAKGLVYKQIGVELGVAASTVRTHLFNSYRKLGAADRAQAVLIASKNGWI